MSQVLGRAVIAGATIPSAESVALTVNGAGTLPEIGSGVGPPVVRIDGVLDITAGTGTTAIVIRCRQGGISGPVVGAALTSTLAAGNSGSQPFSFEDVSGYSNTPNAVYVITIAQTGGTANGTLIQGEVEVSL